jgi:hypothetical protein
MVDPSTPVAWVPFPTTPRQVPPPTPAETTNPMLFVVPPSQQSPSTQPLTRAASGPPNPSVPAVTDETGATEEAKPSESPTRAVDPSAAAGQAASALRAGAEPESEPKSESVPVRTLADYGPKPSDHTEPVAEEPVAELPAFPFPPAPPGEPGYAPTDVARLATLLANTPDREQLAKLTFGVTTTGGYHTGTIDALRQAWLDALATKRP